MGKALNVCGERIHGTAFVLNCNTSIVDVSLSTIFTGLGTVQILTLPQSQNDCERKKKKLSQFRI